MYYKGFYEDFFNLKNEFSNEDEDITFEFLENTNESFDNDKLSVIDLFKYLHGYCDEFAMLLNKVFHYQIEISFNCGNIIHAYCKHGDYYIDVRGITNDKDLFFSEFKDDLNKETHRECFFNVKEAYQYIKDNFGNSYKIVYKDELELLSQDKFLKYYYLFE